MVLLSMNVTQPVVVGSSATFSGRDHVGYFWGPSPPSSPTIDAVWMDSLSVVLKKWNGTAWVNIP